MSLRDFIAKQWIDVIEWVEPEEGILAYRYPMQDREIQNGGKLTVRDSQAALFVNEGKVADIFTPGLYTLTTQTLSSPTSISSPREFRPISTGVRKTPSPFATRNSVPSVFVASAFTRIT
jgi:membrane protease subunit (stomatin/prohibitin family)